MARVLWHGPLYVILEFLYQIRDYLITVLRSDFAGRWYLIFHGMYTFYV